MQNDANVVHLTRVASEPSPNAGAGRLPVILVQVRDKAALQLKQALQALFDNADDTLFEMADRATSNLEQNAFFEAMRDLRLKRKSIERVYLQKVFEEFSALNQVQSGKSVPTLDTVSFDSLSLVQNEELEESVAVDAMVARVMSRDASALAHLSTRLNTLVGRKVDEKSNPLAPRPLTSAFLDACQGLGVEIKVKLIILKLFEKYVLAHCDQLYAEANQILVAAGVLPELKSALPRRQPAVRPEAVRERTSSSAGLSVSAQSAGLLQPRPTPRTSDTLTLMGNRTRKEMIYYNATSSIPASQYNARLYLASRRQAVILIPLFRRPAQPCPTPSPIPPACTASTPCAAW